ncbi:MAG: hypothetical protein K6A65_05680 [Succinivibrionaceae bacterium]|nr:hypothetical protein [Succinivibrionaceae bacterium]
MDKRRMLTRLAVSLLAPAIIMLSGCAADRAAEGGAQYGNAASFTIDPVSGKYLRFKARAVSLPVGVLHLPREPDAAGIAALGQRLDAAPPNKLKSLTRTPVAIQRGDGTFSVLEGADTVSLLKARGARSVPVLLDEPFSSGVRDIDGLYASNRAARGEFEALVSELHALIPGELAFRPGEKKRERVQEKMKNFFGGKAQYVTDLLAARIVVNDSASIATALKVFAGRPEVVQVKDRWKNPTRLGYRDLLTLIQLPSGVVGELQVVHRDIESLGVISHGLYEFFRAHASDPSKAWEASCDKAQAVSQRILGLAADDQVGLLLPAKADLERAARGLPAARTQQEALSILGEMEAILGRIAGQAQAA